MFGGELGRSRHVPGGILETQSDKEFQSSRFEFTVRETYFERSMMPHYIINITKYSVGPCAKYISSIAISNRHRRLVVTVAEQQRVVKCDPAYTCDVCRL